VNVLLNQDWPVDTLLQVSLWTSPDIDATLALMQVRRIAQQQPFHKDMLSATVEFLGQGAQSALDGATGIRLRRMQVLVTVKLPMAGAMPTENDIRRAAELRLSTFQSLGTIGLRPETLRKTRRRRCPMRGCISANWASNCWRTSSSACRSS
jgi:conjugal transfer ATP-binding protein TraC